MTDTPERIMEIRKATYLSGIGNIQDAMARLSFEEQSHVLISRMEEAIAYTVGGHYEPFFFGIRRDMGDDYDVMGLTHKSRLEATFAAWQAIQEKNNEPG